MPFASILLFVLCSFLCNPVDACNQLDHDSLLSSFSSPVSTLLNWSSIDCCQWEGITCDPNGSVTRLWIPSRGLTGGIAPPITNLTYLSHLNLSHNSLTGPLPNHLFSSLSLLEVLDLSHNMLQGELPPSSSFSSNNLPASIQMVDVSNNRFHGSIPSSFLQKAYNLQHFDVSSNIFTGAIPSSLCVEFSSAKLLDFSRNAFRGDIPRGLGRCSKLEVLRMDFNSLSGTIPNEIYQISTLLEVNLASNKLWGHIGSSITNLTSLTFLDFHLNELTGGLPSDMGKLSKLESLSLGMNNLSGTIPASLMNCTHLKELRLDVNFLEGTLSDLNFSNLLSLSILDLNRNFFAGPFPTSIYSCKSLRAIRLSGNKVEWRITSDILALRSLSFLSLYKNRLTNITETIRVLSRCKALSVLFLGANFIGETMPDDVDVGSMVGQNGGFQNLKLLSLWRCLLIGQLPNWFKMLKNLQVLHMADNRLTGPIPHSLGSLPNLFYIDLSNNLITGSIPVTLCGLRALATEQLASNPNRTNLELPIYFAFNFSYVKKPLGEQYNRLADLPRIIFLSNNSLLNTIPPEIGRLKFLQSLDLSHNNLSGSIPNEISKLSGLESLILSSNSLSGEVPVSLTHLNFLREFSVSFNNLQGPVPEGTQLQSFGVSAYEGNKKLCGPPLLNQCQNARNGNNETKDGPEENSDDGNSLMHYMRMSMGVGFIAGFSAVCWFMLLSDRSWRCANV